jgi:hypothetical protein
MANDKKKKGSGLDGRNAQIMAAAASGTKSQSEIAEDFGLSRGHVNKILNSSEAAEFAEKQRLKIIELVEKAVKVLDHNLDKNDLNAASMAFKIAGFYIEKHEHSSSKPFIVKLTDGSEIHMGHKDEKEEK